ncbi:MAG: V-type ATP synthase subunit A [Bacillota bacterium]
MSNKSKVIMINGPVVKANNMSKCKMREMVTVGKNELIGEIISINEGIGTIQVYEKTEGLSVGQIVKRTYEPLSLKLGPGLIGNMFDGIQRPLKKINEISKNFIKEGIGLLSIDKEKKWDVNLKVKVGDILTEGDIYATVKETSLVDHKLMVPPKISGEVVNVIEDGKYNIEKTLVEIKDKKGNIEKLKMYQKWPVRKMRPVKKRLALKEPLITGQRVLDVFFPLAKGGTAAIPGGFGTGKTSMQHQLAKWSDADIIVYVGCGERGNEMTNVLDEFPKLVDPKSKEPIMKRTILIANTSNMPVAAREASIYTGITLAEYYRDMGYDIAIMADSTSRWAEALREISGRLEEMPAEGGYPAYLPSRLAQFYERAGYCKTLSDNEDEGSITIIGAVSPAGGDFSEPVTQNTKRFVSAFLALDKELAYARHYPAINWLDSYSGYIKDLTNWYNQNISEDLIKLRGKVMNILQKEDELKDIVQLVGQDVLPDDQQLILEIAKIIKIGFLQQNAFHEVDTFVPLPKQHLMLELIYNLYLRAKEAIDLEIPISKVKNEEIFSKVLKMKYDIPNDDIVGIGRLMIEINDYYDNLIQKYE